MAKYSKKVSPLQMSFFPFMNEAPEDDKRPLPLIVADNWNFQLQYQVSDGKPHYAIQDWIAGIAETDTTNASRMWRAMKRRFQKSNIQTDSWCTTLKYQASDGKKYSREFTTDEGLYRIIQRMDVNTPLRDKILIYLAKSGAELDKYRLDGTLQEISDKARAKGIDSRNRLTDAAKNTHIYGNPRYGHLTNMEYHVLFKTKEAKTAKDELVMLLGLDDKQAAKFRDHVHHLALQAMSSAESAIESKMYSENRLLSDSEQLEIVRYCCRIIAPAFQHLAQYAGIDLLSGRPLLKAGQ